MDSTKPEEIDFEFPPFIRVYKDGRAERILITDIVPPSIDPTTGVSSKDLVIQPETGLSARLYLPKVVDPTKKLPLLIYFHGGGFIIETAFSPTYHHYLNQLVAEANVVAVSVDYRKAPEHPVPVAYEDSWKSLEWVVSQSKDEEWLKKYADFDRVFMAGDSAGANIAHNMAIRAGVSELNGLKIYGIALIHPYFCGAEPIGSEIGNQLMIFAGKLWNVVCPSATGLDDPFVNPVKDPNLSRLGCKKVLVCVAEQDALRDRGEFYFDYLKESEWNGVVEYMESEGENHVFHLFNPACENAKNMMTKLVSFINSAE
ncbi:hypothetical protein ACHQM5_024232 [Ranunculus cassubicifolius]